MIYASTFLSHSSTDKPLVEAVAHELGRRGIVAWLDKNELSAGISLDKELREAIQQQVTFTPFLSPAALASFWVEDELATALELYDTPGNKGLIIPIYLGDPLELVSSHRLLKNRWLHPDGNRVARRGVVVQGEEAPVILAKRIADEIAKKIYKALNIADQREVVLHIDQRGVGPRQGISKSMPENILTSNAPALIFRPNLGARSQSEILHGVDWNEMRLTIKWALSTAFEQVRWPSPKKIRICGDAQLGFPFILGQYFNRSTCAHLFCMNVRDGNVFNNQDQPRHCPLEGGNPHCETQHRDIPSIPSGTRLDAISLLLSLPHYVAPVIRYLATQQISPPLVWVESMLFKNNQQVMDYVRDVVALLMRLSQDNGLRTVHLFCGLPFHVLPILAANLLHVVDNVLFMEYRRDLQGSNMMDSEMYTTLQTTMD